jgi:hypothetical protein
MYEGRSRSGVQAPFVAEKRPEAKHVASAADRSRNKRMLGALMGHLHKAECEQTALACPVFKSESKIPDWFRAAVFDVIQWDFGRDPEPAYMHELLQLRSAGVHQEAV